MPNCAVAICKNRSQNTKGMGIRYFGFPKNEDLAKQWLIACNRSDKINLKSATICSNHFKPSCFKIPLIQKMLQYTPKNGRNFKSDAVPTENISKVIIEPCKKRKLEEKIVRLAKRRCQKEGNQIVNELRTKYTNKLEADTDSNVNISSHTEHLPNLHCKQETWVKLQEDTMVVLRENMRMLEQQNKELLEKIDLRDKTIKQLEAALAILFTPDSTVKHKQDGYIGFNKNTGKLKK